MPKFLSVKEIAAVLNESPEIIVKECEMRTIPYNKTPEGVYMFTLEDVLAVRQPGPVSAKKEEPKAKVAEQQDEKPHPTKREGKPKASKKAR